MKILRLVYLILRLMVLLQCIRWSGQRRKRKEKRNFAEWIGLQKVMTTIRRVTNEHEEKIELEFRL